MLQNSTKWESAHRPIAHIIGWRVTLNTPLGSALACASASGVGSAGLPMNEPASRIIAGRVMRLAAIQPISPEPGRSACGAATNV